MNLPMIAWSIMYWTHPLRLFDLISYWGMTYSLGIQCPISHYVVMFEDFVTSLIGSSWERFSLLTDATRWVFNSGGFGMVVWRLGERGGGVGQRVPPVVPWKESFRWNRDTMGQTVAELKHNYQTKIPTKEKLLLWNIIF